MLLGVYGFRIQNTQTFWVRMDFVLISYTKLIKIKIDYYLADNRFGNNHSLISILLILRVDNFTGGLKKKYVKYWHTIP